MIKGKKITAAILLLILVMCQTLFASAADGSKNIVFEGDSGKFVGDLTSTEGFTNMEPGEKREVKINLKNTDSEELRFYMSAEILTNIANATDSNKEAIYTFTIANNDEVFLSTVIGDGEINTSIGEEHLENTNYILLATLGKDESTTVTLALELDGDSAGNSYMLKEGELGLVFMAQTGTEVLPKKGEPIYKTVPNYVKGSTIYKNVKTGDPASIALVAIVGVSLLLIVILLVKKIKDKKEVTL